MQQSAVDMYTSLYFILRPSIVNEISVILYCVILLQNKVDTVYWPFYYTQSGAKVRLV